MPCYSAIHLTKHKNEPKQAHVCFPFRQCFIVPVAIPGQIQIAFAVVLCLASAYPEVDAISLFRKMSLVLVLD